LPSDPAILGFDSSGPWIEAAVIRGEDILALRRIEMPKGQGEALPEVLAAVLAEAGLGWQDLAALGVGTGPGNFTGIRIATALARGLALGLGIPAIGVTRFEAMALDGPDLPVIVPALRGQVWVARAAEPPFLTATPPVQAIGEGRMAPAHPLALAIARLARARRGNLHPRPAPLYLRDADAAPPSEAPPVLID